MQCAHADTIPDPEWTARSLALAAESEPVCLDCGMCLLACPDCRAVYSHGPLMFGADNFCHVCSGCRACCREFTSTTRPPLLPADRARAVRRCVEHVAEHYIERAIRAAADDHDAAAVARREISKGGCSARGERIDGFRNSYNKGRGADVEIGHRRGIVTWGEIAGYVRSLPLAAAICLACGYITESGFEIDRCDLCYCSNLEKLPATTDPSTNAQSPLFEDRPRRGQISLF